MNLQNKQNWEHLGRKALVALLLVYLGQAGGAQAADPVLSPADEPQPEDLEAVHDDKPQSMFAVPDQSLTIGYSYGKRFYSTSDSRYLERHGLSLFYQRSVPYQSERIVATAFQSSINYRRILESPVSPDRFFPSFVGLRMTLASDNDFTRSLAAFSMRFYLPLDADERNYDDFIGAPALAFHYQYRLNEGFLRGTTIGYNGELKRSFRRYQTNRGGWRLEQYSLTNSLDLTVPVRTVSGLSLRASALRADRWDYDEIQYPLEYVLSYGLGYAVSPSMAVSASAVQGDQLFSLGGDPNLQLLDENQTFYVFGVNYSLSR